MNPGTNALNLGTNSMNLATNSMNTGSNSLDIFGTNAAPANAMEDGLGLFGGAPTQSSHSSSLLDPLGLDNNVAGITVITTIKYSGKRLRWVEGIRFTVPSYVMLNLCILCKYFSLINFVLHALWKVFKF